MRRVLIALLALSSLAAVPTADAGAEPAPSGTVVTRVVRTGAEYRQAIVDLNADDSGAHRIVLARDLVLGADPVPSYTSTRPLTIDGRGHTMRGRVPVFLVSDGTPGRLTMHDLTIVGGASGVSWNGIAVIRDTTFRRVGRGHPLATTSPVIGVHDAVGQNAVALLTDVLVEDTRSTAIAIASQGALTATRLVARGIDAGWSAVGADGRLRLVRSVVTANVARQRALIKSEGGPVALVDTFVTRNTRPNDGGTSPVVEARTTIRLDRSWIVGNGPVTEPYALRARDLVARRSLVLHPGTACAVTGTVVARRSLASDRSCRF